MDSLADIIKKIGVGRLSAIAIVTAFLLGAFVFLLDEANKVTMAPLFSNLDINDSSAIIETLESQGTPYELSSDGSTILVPQTDVLRLRMDMARSGLPKGGSAGYELFDSVDMLGSTSFVQSINKIRAIEGELARTIMTLRGVKLARVHLVMPERKLFSKDQDKPTASVVIRRLGGLAPDQVRAVQSLVASAVPGLEINSVTVIDENGQLLSSPDEGSGLAAGSAFLDNRMESTEQRLARKVEAMVEQVVGQGKARAQVSVEFDQVRETTQSENYDPATQVVRSQQTREEQNQLNETTPSDVVTVANEVPRDVNSNGGNDKRTESGNKTEEVVNYEISKTTTTAIKEAGQIKRISLALVVDGTYEMVAGVPEYQARSEEEMKQIRALARTAVGYMSERGDSVEVVNLPFAVSEIAPLAGEPNLIEQLLNPSQEDIMRLIEQGVILLLGLAFLFFAIRPLMKKATTSEAGQANASLKSTGGMHLTEEQLAALAEAAKTTNSDDDTASGDIDIDTSASSDYKKLVKEADFAGKFHAETVSQVNDLIRDNPREAVIILRQWMSSEKFKQITKSGAMDTDKEGGLAA